MELRKKIIDEVYPYLQSIGLTGMGETLFAKDLVKTARYIKEKKNTIVIFISTNANIHDFIERIEPVLPWIDTVQISIDGIDELYEKMRPGASFSLLESNIKQLVPLARKYNVDIMFNMVLTKLNHHHMVKVLEFAHEMGVEYVNYNYFNLASVTDVGVDYYGFFMTEEFKQSLDQLQKLHKRYKKIEISGLDNHMNTGATSCPLLLNHFQVNYDGEIPPCCAKPFSREYSYGNAGDLPLIDVINSEKAKTFRRAWFKGRPHKFCEKCQYTSLEI